MDFIDICINVIMGAFTIGIIAFVVSMIMNLFGGDDFFF